MRKLEAITIQDIIKNCLKNGKYIGGDYSDGKIMFKLVGNSLEGYYKTGVRTTVSNFTTVNLYEFDTEFDIFRWLYS